MREGSLHLGAQLVNGQLRGVDDDVRLLPQRLQHRPFGRDPIRQPPAALQRMRAAVGLVPADQGRVARLQEQHPRPVAASVQILDDLGEVVGEGPGPDVQHDRDTGDVTAGPGTQIDHGGDEFRWQVVHDEPAQVLQALGGRRTPGAGQPGHDGDLDARRWLLLAGWPIDLASIDGLLAVVRLSHVRPLSVPRRRIR